MRVCRGVCNEQNHSWGGCECPLREPMCMMLSSMLWELVGDFIVCSKSGTFLGCWCVLKIWEEPHFPGRSVSCVHSRWVDYSETKLSDQCCFGLKPRTTSRIQCICSSGHQRDREGLCGTGWVTRDMPLQSPDI